MVVATVLTACGIETMNLPCEGDYGAVVLQQYLPLAVLKRLKQQRSLLRTSFKLQQYLPLAVLKRKYSCFTNEEILEVATVLTACGIETVRLLQYKNKNSLKLQQYLPLAVLKPSNFSRSDSKTISCNSTYRLRY